MRVRSVSSQQNVARAVLRSLPKRSASGNRSRFVSGATAIRCAVQNRASDLIGALRICIILRIGVANAASTFHKLVRVGPAARANVGHSPHRCRGLPLRFEQPARNLRLRAEPACPRTCSEGRSTAANSSRGSTSSPLGWRAPHRAHHLRPELVEGRPHPFDMLTTVLECAAVRRRLRWCSRCLLRHRCGLHALPHCTTRIAETVVTVAG